MEGVPATVWLEIIRTGGPVVALVLGLVLIGWLNTRWVDSRLESQRVAHEAVLSSQRAAHDAERIEWRDQFHEMMAQYSAHMSEMRHMYESNVTLVKGYEGLSKDLCGVITLNMQTMTRLVERIDHNMTCPIATGRIDLAAILAGRGKG